jgi:hypothetical protein
LYAANAASFVFQFQLFEYELQLYEHEYECQFAPMQTNCGISLAYMAKNNDHNTKSAGTKGERDLFEAKAVRMEEDLKQ